MFRKLIRAVGGSRVVLPTVLLVTATAVIASNCPCLDYQDPAPGCDTVGSVIESSCAAQCGDLTHFNSCEAKRGAKYYPIDWVIESDAGYKNQSYDPSPQLCADIYTCQTTETVCSGPGFTQYQCAAGQWADWVETDLIDLSGDCPAQ